MASYHLSVKTVKRSEGRSATAAAAYRAAVAIGCARQGVTHDYTRKQGVEDSFILAPDGSPEWVQDRSALWNAVEGKERRLNSVVAREWELALPAEVSSAARVELARDFASALVRRYGVVADVAIHAPHRDGDQRNHHAHILTTTRSIGSEGLGAKTRVLDAAKTGGSEIADMRGLWAEMQNKALALAGQQERVDHRSLKDQREDALDRGDDLAAAELDRAPEIKLGPAANAMERKAVSEAARDGVNYTPVTERGAQNHEIRQQRDLLSELRQRAERARVAYSEAREKDASRISAAVEAAKVMFADTEANNVFARGIIGIQRQRDAERERIEAEQREQERQQRLAEERKAFVEEMALAWQDAREEKDPALQSQRQGEVRAQVEEALERLEVPWETLADGINERSNEIREEREQQRQVEEQQKLKQRVAYSGWSMS